MRSVAAAKRATLLSVEHCVVALGVAHSRRFEDTAHIWRLSLNSSSLWLRLSAAVGFETTPTTSTLRSRLPP